MRNYLSLISIAALLTMTVQAGVYSDDTDVEAITRSLVSLPRASVVKVNSQNFESEVEEYKGLLIIDVYADWCGACKKMAPIFESLSEEYPDIKFVKIDYDKSKALVGKYHIMALPTFLFFNEGKVVGRYVGYKDLQGFKKLIDKTL